MATCIRTARSRRGRLGLALLALTLVVASSSSILAQDPANTPPPEDPNDPVTKLLTDPDKREEAIKKRQLPPIEFFRSQVLPNDILP